MLKINYTKIIHLILNEVILKIVDCINWYDKYAFGNIFIFKYTINII